MKTLLFFLFLSPQLLADSFREVVVPRISSVNAGKRDFIREVGSVSRELFPGTRSAIAPFGGVKVTPILELDLTTLIIVTNSYPGTVDEITGQFKEGARELQEVLRLALANGSMSTSDVLRVVAGAQLLSRLKLELGVSEVEQSYWVTEGQDSQEKAFSDRSMDTEEKGVATVFDFFWNGRKTRLVFLSSFIHSDSAERPGYPELLRSLVPDTGLNWAYLSADGLGHFSANEANGLVAANRELLDLLALNGAVLLDYPTDRNYHTSQIYGGITFMNGRLDLERLGLLRTKTIPVVTKGVFGYCLKEGDEVRIYQKQLTPNFPKGPKLKQVGKTQRWLLR